MMYVVDTVSGEVVFTIVGSVGNIDEAIQKFGRYDNGRASNGEPDIEFDGNWYYYDDLILVKAKSDDGEILTEDYVSRREVINLIREYIGVADSRLEARVKYMPAASVVPVNPAGE